MKTVVPLFLLCALPLLVMTLAFGQDAKVANEEVNVKKPTLTFYYYDQ